ncbi:polymorphic toxin-type HINT domain-containing protein [Streptomyces sp. NPDC058667]|uniref:polymorphic toxin-type HINT domain-containing protein n=1 Tax=Streptomyces sp. NPDC058667 TaxID=3346588 RepID=UPI00364EF7F0
MATLISTASAGAEDLPVTPLSDRARVLQAWKTSGPAVRSAAEQALTGTDTQVRDYLASGERVAEELDLREAALTLVTEAGPEVSAAAANALSGTGDQLAAFMKDGWKQPLEEDQRLAAARATEAGGIVVREAGDAAMNGSIDDIRAFLSEGQYKSRDEDARLRVAQIEKAGGPATKRAASAALNAGITEVRDFLAYGQYITRAQDQEHASITDLAKQTTDAAAVADKAKASAEAQAEKAKTAAALAKTAAATAAAETLAAANDADKAEDAARRAAESARRAAAAAKAAISAARAANAAAQTAIAAASNAATAAQRASQAASNAWSAAASGKINEKAAADALKAATDAEKIANTLDAMLNTAKAARDALTAGLDAIEDMKSAASSAKQAAGHREKAGADAAQARAAAAAAERHAEEASRASRAAQTHANAAIREATEARDAARSSAAHARKAAEAARNANQHAGHAQAAADAAKAYAAEALKAAQAASAAVTKAEEIQATTRKGEAEEIAARTALIVNEARDAKEATDAAKAKITKITQEALQLQTDFNALAAQAAEPDAQPAQIAANGRRMAMTALQIRGPWSRAAAEVALTGDDAAVVAYARTGWKQAGEEDEREAVHVLATQSPHEDVRTAATATLAGTPAQVHTFLTAGQYQVAAEANRIEVARIAGAGGTVVKEDAQAALNAPDPKALDTFLAQGQHQARIEDYRLEAASLAQAGGPEVKAAAEAALASPDTNLTTFITSGRHKATRRDQLNAAHIEQIQSILATAAQTAALAHKSAYHAAEAAENAQGHSDLAAGHAQTATTYAEQAAGHAYRAQQAATRASISAKSAASSATAARKAEAQASSSARKARNAAISAEASYGAAQGYAASAFQAAEQARQSALNAGQSATEAYAKYRSTVVRYQTERYTAEQQALLDQRMADYDSAMQQEAEAGGQSDLNNLILALVHNQVPPGMSLKEYIHLKLDILGLFPVVGEPADAVNCIAYAVESNLANNYGIGDKDAAKDAVLSCAAMLPVAGWLAAGAKGVRWADKFGTHVDEVFESIGNFFKKNPCNPKHSFPAGTRVLMADGTKRPIELVRIGDWVQAADPTAGTTSPRRVLDTIYTPDDRNFTGITLRGTAKTEALTATDNHPFWSPKEQSWVEAGQLAAGDTLKSADGSAAEISGIRRWSELQAAYNLTVENLHTYFVMAGSVPVLVHNTATACPILSGDARKHIKDYHSPGSPLRTSDKTYWTIPEADWNRAINEVLKRDPHGSANTRGRDGTIHRAEMPEDIGDGGWIGKSGPDKGDYELDHVEVILNPDGSIRNAYPWSPAMPGAF